MYKCLVVVVVVVLLLCCLVLFVSWGTVVQSNVGGVESKINAANTAHVCYAVSS